MINADPDKALWLTKDNIVQQAENTRYTEREGRLLVFGASSPSLRSEDACLDFWLEECPVARGDSILTNVFFLTFCFLDCTMFINPNMIREVSTQCS